MPDIPPEAIRAAAEAICECLYGRPTVMTGVPPSPPSMDDLALAALAAAAPALGDHAAVKILAHMEAHGPQVTGRRGSVDRHLQEQRRHAYRMHFGTAARVAGRAFLTEDDVKRLAAEALARGDYVACPALEDTEQ